MPGGPVGEEQDMAAFLLDHRLERIDQRWRKVAGALGELEQAEGKETVDAFAETRNHKGPFRIPGFHIGGLGCESYAVGRNHARQNLLVPALLEGVESNGLAQQR